MKKAALRFALLLLPTLSLFLGTALASAGSANPGGTRTVTVGPQSTLEKRLRGRWKFAFMQWKHRRQAVPSSLHIILDFQPGGQLVHTVGRGSKQRRQVGTWMVTRGQIHIRLRIGGTVKLFHLKGKELILTPPKGGGSPLIFTRLRPNP